MLIKSSLDENVCTSTANQLIFACGQYIFHGQSEIAKTNWLEKSHE